MTKKDFLINRIKEKQYRIYKFTLDTLNDCYFYTIITDDYEKALSFIKHCPKWIKETKSVGFVEVEDIENIETKEIDCIMFSDKEFEELLRMSIICICEDEINELNKLEN
jgi:hypothetical protein